MEAVVEMLKVEWESPPVPTMSHYRQLEPMLARIKTCNLRVATETHQATLVISLSLTTGLDNLFQARLVHLEGGFSHSVRALGDDLGISIFAGRVQEGQ